MQGINSSGMCRTSCSKLFFQKCPPTLLEGQRVIYYTLAWWTNKSELKSLFPFSIFVLFLSAFKKVLPFKIKNYQNIWKYQGLVPTYKNYIKTSLVWSLGVTHPYIRLSKQKTTKHKKSLFRFRQHKTKNI